MSHENAHPMAGETVTLLGGIQHPQHECDGAEYRVEDWWDRLGQGSWMFCTGNPACMLYAVRAAAKGLPMDDEVLYGKVGGMGVLIHTSEIEGADAAPLEEELYK